MKGATAAVKGLIVAFFMIFSLLFISIALSILISDWIGAPSSGFFVIGGIYLLMGMLTLVYGGKVINRMMLQKASRKIFSAPEAEDSAAADLHPEHGEDEITIENERI